MKLLLLLLLDWWGGGGEELRVLTNQQERKAMDMAAAVQDLNRSCWICGYFGRRSYTARLSDGCSGRCHAFDSIDTPEALLITHGTERNTAANCPRFFRRSQHLTVGEFVTWRSGIATDLHRQATERQFRIITLLLAGCAFIDFTCKALGLWG